MKGFHYKAALIVAGSASVLFAAAGQNLITNGGFESGTTGWSLGVNGDTAAATRIIDSVSGDAHEGTKFYRITVTAVSSQNWHVQVKDPTWQANLNYIYHFSMWARSDAPRNAQISVYGGPDSKDTYRTSSTIALTTEWKQYHQMFISDVEGMGKINFALVCGGATGVYDMDDVIITGVENTDGSLYANGDFEAEGAGWSLNVNAAEGATGAATISYPSTGAKSGTKYCSIIVTSVPEESWEVQLSDGSWTCVEDENYTFSFWAKADVDGANVQVAAQAGSSRNYDYLGGVTFTLTTDWAEYSYAYTATGIAGPDSVSFNIYCGYSLGTFDFDAISLSLATPVRYTPAALTTAASPFVVHALPGELRCVAGNGGMIDKVFIHDIQGRVFYTGSGTSGTGTSNSFSLPLPRSGTWIVRAISGKTELRQSVVVP